MAIEDLWYKSAIIYCWRNTSLLTVHHFGDRPQHMRLDPQDPKGGKLVDVFDDRHSDADESGFHQLDLKPYDYRWYRLGAADNALYRTAL